MTAAIEAELLAEHYERRPQSIKDEANHRLAVIEECESERWRGRGKREAIQAVAAERGLSWHTVNVWYRLVKGRDRSTWLYALAPRHVGCSTTAEIDADAWDAFKADYLRPERPSLSACYERLKRIESERGWILPSIATFKRKIKREIGNRLTRLARFGRDAGKAMFPPQRRDTSPYAPLDVVNADAHKLDVFVRWGPKGPISRPHILAWQDVRTRKILSWRVGPDPCAELVRLSFGDVVEHFGVPRAAVFDNGREFASKWLSGGMKHRFRFKAKPDEPLGIFTQLGVEVDWTTPYSGQSKPIERAFGTLCAERIAKAPDLAGAYTGRNPIDKPDNYESRAVALDVLLRVIAREVESFNARPSTAYGLDGRSPDVVFAELIPSAVIRRASPKQRALWLLAAEGVKARKPSGEIHLYGNRFWSSFLSDHVGKSLTIRFDPQSLHRPLRVYARDGRYLGEAECIADIGFRDKNAAQEFNRQRNAGMRADKQRLEAEVRMSALEVARALPAPQGGPTTAPPVAPAAIGAIMTRSANAPGAPLDETAGAAIPIDKLRAERERLAALWDEPSGGDAPPEAAGAKR